MTTSRLLKRLAGSGKANIQIKEDAVDVHVLSDATPEVTEGKPNDYDGDKSIIQDGES